MQAGRIEPVKSSNAMLGAKKNRYKNSTYRQYKHWPGYAEICKKISGKN